MSSSYNLPAIAVWKSKNLLELLKKNNISPDNVQRVIIGPRHLQVVSEEIARNVSLVTGEFVTVHLDSSVYWSGILLDS